MESITISVIIPVYNTVGWMLEQCFDSVLRQTYPITKILVCDDGSTHEDTLEVLERYQREHPEKFEVFRQENAGISKARNTCLEHVQTEYLMFLDSDDFWSTDCLEQLVDVLSPSKQPLDVVFFGIRYVDHQGDTLLYVHPERREVLQTPSQYLYYTCGCGGRIYRTAYVNSLLLTFPNGCIMEDAYFSSIIVACTGYVNSICYYGYNVRANDSSFCRSRKKINCQNIATIPLAHWKKALETVTPASEDQEYMLYRTLMEAMLGGSVIFTCYSSKEEAVKFTVEAANFVRQYIPHYMRLSFSSRHNAQAHSLTRFTLALYGLAVLLRCERPFSAAGRFAMRLYYKIKRLDSN